MVIFNGVHNHELEQKLGGHLLAGRLREEDKKKVVVMSKSLALPRNIFMDLKEKKSRKFDEYKTSVQCTF